MGIVELVDMQAASGIKKDKAVVFTAYQRLHDRKRERLLPAYGLCSAIPQTGYGARAGKEGFVTQAHGIEARRTGQSREGFRMAEEAFSAPFWDVETEDPISPTATPQ